MTLHLGKWLSENTRDNIDKAHVLLCLISLIFMALIYNSEMGIVCLKFQEYDHFCGHHSQKWVQRLESAARVELIRFECVSSGIRSSKFART